MYVRHSYFCVCNSRERDDVRSETKFTRNYIVPIPIAIVIDDTISITRVMSGHRHIMSHDSISRLHYAMRECVHYAPRVID